MYVSLCSNYQKQRHKSDDTGNACYIFSTGTGTHSCKKDWQYLRKFDPNPRITLIRIWIKFSQVPVLAIWAPEPRQQRVHPLLQALLCKFLTLIFFWPPNFTSFSRYRYRTGSS
jgi:hypothetical protein